MCDMCNKLINIKISAVQELLISNNLNISNKICSLSFLPAETANNCALFGILERITARKQHFQFVQGVLNFSLIKCPEARSRSHFPNHFPARFFSKSCFPAIFFGPNPIPKCAERLRQKHNPSPFKNLHFMSSGFACVLLFL